MSKWLFALALAACLWPVRQADAQAYPNRTVTITVTSAAGGLTDVLTRAVAQRLSQMWNQTVVIENRGGAGHTLAAAAIAKSPADGYALLATETGMFTMQPHLYAKGKLPFATEDFVPIAGFASIPMALLVHPSVPANSVKELIALAKDKPGTISYGTAGLGTSPHMGAALLESLAGIKLTAIHYRGANPALNDVIAGHINMITMGPSIALPTVRAGKIKMLGFGSLHPRAAVRRRSDDRRDHSGLSGRRVVRLVRAGCRAARDRPQDQCRRSEGPGRSGVPREILDPQVVEPVPNSPEAYAGYIQSELDKWGKVIRGANLRID